MSKIRQFLSRLTSPIFIPLRRLVIWSDTRFGTCDVKLCLEPRWNHSLDGFADIDEPILTIDQEE